MVALRVEPIACPTLKVEEILGHIIIEVLLCRDFLLIVPVSLLINLYWLAAYKPFAHLLYAQHIAPVIRHPCVIRRVYPKPFAKR